MLPGALSATLPLGMNGTAFLVAAGSIDALPVIRRGVISPVPVSGAGSHLGFRTGDRISGVRYPWAFGLAGLMLAAVGAALAFETKPNLPYNAIEHLEFIPANRAAFLSNRDRLIGVTDGRIAKAYPAAIVAQHGLVQDNLSDGPIAVTW